MLNLLRRFTALSGVIALVRGPAGQKALAKARTYLRDPRTQQRITDLRTRFARTPR